MKRYIALIRGINVGGNNSVSMGELRRCFTQTGFSAVSTYGNSGNVIFSSEDTQLTNLVKKCEHILLESFQVRTKVAVIPVSEFREALEQAPEWWGVHDDMKHNALFVIAPASAQEIMDEIKQSKPENEKIDLHSHLLFWSAPLKTFDTTRWTKIVSATSYDKITIRNANTIKKLYALTSQSSASSSSSH